MFECTFAEIQGFNNKSINDRINLQTTKHQTKII